MELSVQYNQHDFKIIVDKTNTHIENSYRITKRKDMRNLLKLIQEKTEEEYIINQLSISSQIHEWRAHNLLYAFGIQRNRTKDVDLNKESWWRRACYAILSLLYWHW